ncbi:type II secretion system F family protein [Streptomyces sp. ET3-23]|uniref:type II secretion system F family protein n=1 Tax=Streptomyces sp. ET3-23 TaxID=2885643 RepID=UPI001D10C029|nr:type II secretion system F family protein [Streptomyces sp. ET3-23]MCC2280846.1 type II secretion system F family protein [Streptomyces sp. ET3-23]
MTVVIAVLCGMAVVAGIIGTVAGVTGTTAPPAPAMFARRRTRPNARSSDVKARVQRRTRWVAAAVLAAEYWLVTGVFVAGLLLGLAVVGVPWLLSGAQSAKARIGQLEGLAEWTQRLADVLRLGMGLEQAMLASRKGTPEAIEEQVGNLADRLQAGWRPEDALRAMADELADVTADKVLAALILSASDRGPGLAQALEDMAESVREEVAKRRHIEADRAKPRQTVRWMTLITLGIVAVGFLVPGYTAPYGTLLGQLVLGVLSLAFVGVLVWMRQLADHRPVPRFLVPDPRSHVRTPHADTEHLETA